MPIDYLVVGGNLQGNIIKKDKLMKKLTITESVISSTKQKTTPNPVVTMDVMHHSFDGNRYAIAINGTFGDDIIDELIIKYKPNPIPNNFVL
ncbi:TPA: hypothetical protein OTY85_001087 [Proteus mirabilis]|nr:hypothetical protein [Proteus mirabilis]HCT4877223.1 hypothetical protein [Proteus mirabilis]